MYKVIYNGILKNQGESFSKRFKLIFFSILRKIILKFNQPLINANLWGFTLKLPFSHNLPVILKLYKNYSSNLRRISGYLSTKYSGLKIIDIGANVGDTIALLKSQSDFEILCIEGDDKFFEILKLNASQFSKVTLVKTFLGEAESKLKGTLDSKLGTGSIQESDKGEINIKALDNLLDEYKEFKNSKLIKIDTDGYDFKILRGSEKYIKEVKPVIFIEFDPAFHKMFNEHSEWIFEFLEPLGYDMIIFYDNYGDYLLSLSINEKDKIYQLINYISNRNKEKYYDLCFFHSEDTDVFELAKKEELKFFLKNR